MSPVDPPGQLDFGLAKALAPEGSASAVDAMNSPTLTAQATKMGMIVGTAADMSPEQVRGKAVDRRADIRSEPAFSASRPEVLFEVPFARMAWPQANYDVARDGKTLSGDPRHRSAVAGRCWRMPDWRKGSSMTAPPTQD